MSLEKKLAEPSESLRKSAVILHRGYQILNLVANLWISMTLAICAFSTDSRLRTYLMLMTNTKVDEGFCRYYINFENDKTFVRIINTIQIKEGDTNGSIQ